MDECKPLDAGFCVKDVMEKSDIAETWGGSHVMDLRDFAEAVGMRSEHNCPCGGLDNDSVDGCDDEEFQEEDSGGNGGSGGGVVGGEWGSGSGGSGFARTTHRRCGQCGAASATRKFKLCAGCRAGGLL